MALKALVFSDIHGHDKGLAYVKKQVGEHGPDLVLIAGDATDYSDPNSTLEFLDSLGAEVFLVPGNMDRFAGVEGFGNVINIHTIREERRGVGFVGFGAVHMNGLDLPRLLSGIAKPGDVLLTHFPAKGFNDRTHTGSQAGSSQIARAVKELGLGMLVSGHIHESPGVVREDGVYYLNPGPAYEHRGLLVTFGDEILVSKL